MWWRLMTTLSAPRSKNEMRDPWEGSCTARRLVSGWPSTPTRVNRRTHESRGLSGAPENLKEPSNAHQRAI